jgi:hypothetical protein
LSAPPLLETPNSERSMICLDGLTWRA